MPRVRVPSLTLNDQPVTCGNGSPADLVLFLAKPWPNEPLRTRPRRIGGTPAAYREAPAGPVSVADELAKLNALLRNGVLTQAEFEQQKARLLGA
jgi:hypothetical protein